MASVVINCCLSLLYFAIKNVKIDMCTFDYSTDINSWVSYCQCDIFCCLSIWWARWQRFVLLLVNLLNHYLGFFFRRIDTLYTIRFLPSIIRKMDDNMLQEYENNILTSYLFTYSKQTEMCRILWKIEWYIIYRELN
jgi:hypothetical protein